MKYQSHRNSAIECDPCLTAHLRRRAEPLLLNLLTPVMRKILSSQKYSLSYCFSEQSEMLTTENHQAADNTPPDIEEKQEAENAETVSNSLSLGQVN